MATLLQYPRGSMKVGLIGGGGDNAFFGKAAHRRAISLLETHQLVAGALRSNSEASLRAGEDWELTCSYGNAKDMIDDWAENSINYVVIATPNFAHFEPAKYALENGMPVFCEKPITMTVDEAVVLRNLSRDKKVPFGVAHTYTGHYTMKLMRAVVRSGLLGKIRRREASYLQGWQVTDLGIQQEHRQDPVKSGDFNCNGDINLHNYNDLRYVTGEEPTGVICVASKYGKGRKLDDDVDTLIRFPEAVANSRASQIACGHENDHTLGFYGEHGGVIWAQENARHLKVTLDGFPTMTVERGGAGQLVAFTKSDAVKKRCGDEAVERFEQMVGQIEWATTLPTGHGEDFLVALANHHHEFGRQVHDWHKQGCVSVSPEKYDVPNVEDGLRGMEFLAACKRSVNKSSSWVLIDHEE